MQLKNLHLLAKIKVMKFAKSSISFISLFFLASASLIQPVRAEEVQPAILILGDAELTPKCAVTTDNCLYTTAQRFKGFMRSDPSNLYHGEKALIRIVLTEYEMTSSPSQKDACIASTPPNFSLLTTQSEKSRTGKTIASCIYTE
jgi:hypothetical protein